jgi:Tol biopolymer transport system component
MRCSPCSLIKHLFIVQFVMLFIISSVGHATKVSFQRQGNTTLVSVSSAGMQGDDHSEAPAISSDGRYVAFQSWASSLVDGDSDGASNIFVHDRRNGKTTIVSVAPDGAMGDGDSLTPSISSDGRYVAFHSWASNLAGGDSNERADIFVHDSQTGQITRVSVASDGTQGNDDSLSPSISSDGRYVAFVSFASNLVGGEANGESNIFVHDRQNGKTTRVSLAPHGAMVDGDSFSPSISPDGGYVAFVSSASNLVGDDVNDASDIFVHDRFTGETTRVSVASDGEEGNGESLTPSISSDGRYVAFVSFASNLVDGESNGESNIFVHDRQGGQTSRVSVTLDGAVVNGESFSPSISPDGRYVAFVSSASTLVEGDTNRSADIFVHDRQTGQIKRVSVASNGTEGNGDSLSPSISAEGRYVAFESSASTLVRGDANTMSDIFVHDFLGPGGGGGCSLNPQGTPGFEWFFAVLVFSMVILRRGVSRPL